MPVAAEQGSVTAAGHQLTRHSSCTRGLALLRFSRWRQGPLPWPCREPRARAAPL